MAPIPDVNLDEYLTYLGGLETLPNSALKKAAHAGAFTMVRYIQQNIMKTFSTGAGDLYHSIKLGQIKVEDKKASAEFGSYGIVYAAIHEFGGIIEAKNAPYLHFKTADGAWHKVKKVIMPARPYFRPALLEHAKDMADAIMDVWSKALAKVAARKK